MSARAWWQDVDDATPEDRYDGPEPVAFTRPSAIDQDDPWATETGSAA